MHTCAKSQSSNEIVVKNNCGDQPRHLYCNQAYMLQPDVWETLNSLNATPQPDVTYMLQPYVATALIPYHSMSHYKYRPQKSH